MQIEAEKCRRKLDFFCKSAWHVLEPATELSWGWHLDAIAEHLTAVTNGQIRNLCINIGPGHAKSLMTCVMWPCWEWLTKPEGRWLFASYAASLSIRDSLKCRRLIESDWYQERFGGAFRAGRDEFYELDGEGVWQPVHGDPVFELTSDQNAKVKFENDKTGYRIATSVSGTVTGERGSRVVVDDPHNVKDRESDKKRAAALIWWDEAMSTRLNDARKDAKVIIQQRVHEKDLTGHVLAQGGYEHLCLPTEYEPSRKCVTSIGWEDPRTVEGELLFPDRFGPNEVKEAKLRLGPIGFAGQHQQAPAPASGARFQKAWFRYFKRDGDLYQLRKANGDTWAVKVSDCNRYVVMDPASTEKDQNNKPCYTVIQVWDVTPSYDMLLIDQYREQVQAPDAADAAVTMVRRYDAQWIGIEKDGIGAGIVQTVRKRGITVRAIKARGSKEARSETGEIRMAAGMIHFPEGAPFLFDLEKELLTFPNSDYADQVDTLAHAAIMVQQMGGAPRDEERETVPAEFKDAAVEAKAADNEIVAASPGAKITEAPGGAITDQNVDDWLAGK